MVTVTMVTLATAMMVKFSIKLNFNDCQTIRSLRSDAVHIAKVQMRQHKSCHRLRQPIITMKSAEIVRWWQWQRKIIPTMLPLPPLWWMVQWKRPFSFTCTFFRKPLNGKIILNTLRFFFRRISSHSPWNIRNGLNIFHLSLLHVRFSSLLAFSGFVPLCSHCTLSSRHEICCKQFRSSSWPSSLASLSSPHHCPVSFIGWRTLSQIFITNIPGNILGTCRTKYRTLSHSTTAFNLPTAYNLPGQENISDEDDKEKVLVDPKTVDVKDCTKTQVEDIVKGWIRYIKKVLKSYENKVNNFEYVPMAYRSKQNKKKKKKNAGESIFTSLAHLHSVHTHTVRTHESDIFVCLTIFFLHLMIRFFLLNSMCAFH